MATSDLLKELHKETFKVEGDTERRLVLVRRVLHLSSRIDCQVPTCLQVSKIQLLLVRNYGQAAELPARPDVCTKPLAFHALKLAGKAAPFWPSVY